MATNAQKAASTQQGSSSLSDPAKNSEQTAGVNRKKQKRREKQAAKLAASQAQAPIASHPPNGASHVKNAIASQANPTGSYDHVNGINADHLREDEELFYSDEEPENDQAIRTQSSSKSKRKKKKGRNGAADPQYDAYHMPGAFQPPPPPPPLEPSPQNNTVAGPSSNTQKRSIWNTSTSEERERIKEFWIGLPEVERRKLVKVEKEAVLKKMKEQQKHSCSCSVCGRKRNAIEEELEVLYDAYYEELEQYANHRQLGIDGNHPMLPPPGPYHSPNRMPPRQDSRAARSHASPLPRMAGAFSNEELAEDEYTEDDGLDEEDDEDIDADSFTSDTPHPAAADIFSLGKNLTAQGGILTVADDLLKNDGRRFIDMMEQLAERRMQREEEAQIAARGLNHASAHNHPPMDDDEYEDEDEYDDGSEEEDDYDDDEMESMSEEQRMEEGRRMFQIFAARMFEQRVLTAYREKVADERQHRLFEEEEEEIRKSQEQEAKKARDAAKKKEKKNKQKAIKEEERLKREAEKAEQEAAAQAAEQQRLEEQRARKEAQRKKKEAEKQVQEAERQRKEADKLRKLHEAKELHAEQERKQRENKEREKKRRDEAKRKEREEKEAKEREKRELEAAAKAELEAKQAREREAKERSSREETAKPASQNVPVPIPLARKASSTVPPPPGFSSTASAVPSPLVQIATPALPKVQASAKPRQASRQGSIQSSPKSATQPASSSATSPSSAHVPPSHVAPPMPPKPAQPPTSIPQASNFNSLPIAPPPGIHHPLSGIQMPPAMHNPPFAPGFAGGPPPGILPRGPIGHDNGFAQQPFNSQNYRGFGLPPNPVGFPPGMGSAPRQNIPLRNTNVEAPVIQTPLGIGTTTGHPQPISHSRNASLSNDQPSQIQPIAPPVATVRLPISNGRQDTQRHDIDGASKQLGSSALLDDGDDTLEPVPERSHINSNAHRPSRLGFGGSPAFPDAIGSAKNDVFPRSGWGGPPVGFGTPTMSHHPHWSPAPTNQWSNSAFGNVNTSRQPRALVLRLLICQACKTLANHSLTGEPASYGSFPVQTIMAHIDHNKPPAESSPQLKEVLEICETEGNPQNGGGSLVAINEQGRGICVTWIPDAMQNNRGLGSGPGEIGSPIVPSAHPFGGSRPFSGPSNGGY